MKMRGPIVAALLAPAWFVRIALVGLLTVNPATAQAAQLLQDGQVVIITILEGPTKGRYSHTYRQAEKTFGPTRVVSHSATTLTFRGRRDTCKMTIDGTVRCNKIGNGTWKLK